MTCRRFIVGLLAVFVAFVSAGRAPAAAAAAAEGAGTAQAVPVFRIDGPITESPAGEELPIFAPPGDSLKDLVERMSKAAKDPAVKAVVVLSENGMAGPAQVEELRQAIGKIRAAGK